MSTSNDLILSFKILYFHITPIDTSIQLELENVLKIPSGSASTIELRALFEVGPKWLTIQLNNVSEVINLKSNQPELTRLSNLYGWTRAGVFGKHQYRTFESRSFAPAIGIYEDPACDSGAGAIGA